MLNWIKDRASLIAEIDRLNDEMLAHKERANRIASNAHLNGRALSEALTERDIARIELAVMKEREQRRLANLRKWGSKGAQVTNAKRAALKAVA